MRASAQQLAINFRPQKPRADGTAKAVVAELYDQIGGVPEVMVRLGIGKSQAYAFTDPQSPEEMSFARVMALTGPEATAAVESLAGRAGVVVCRLPKVDRRGATLARIAASAQSHGVAIGKTIEAVEDGTVTPAEFASVRKHITEAIRDLVALQVSLEEG